MYKYESLNREKKQIRLLRISSPTGDDFPSKLVLELRNDSLSDEPIQYAALSYVWGRDASQEMVEVEINGAPFLITRNLHAGLGRLLRAVGHDMVPWLWIDAICINQADDFEKSWQVSQMGAIYSQADIVYMMLGSGTAETDRAMDFIARVGPRAVASGALGLHSRDHYESLRQYIAARPPSPSQGSDETYEGDSNLARFMYDLLHESCLYPSSPPEKAVGVGIEELLTKDYWSRVWINQEVALARRAMVICGERSVSLDDFDGAMMAVSHCGWYGLFLLAPEYDGFGRGVIGTAYETLPSTVRRRRCDGEPMRLADLVYQSGAAPYRPHYSASDPRDIFFALLGVISDGEELGLVADYSKTFEEVHIAATRALLRDGELRPCQVFHLDQCVPTDNSGRSKDLPSWVPDWEGIGKRGIPVYHVGYTKAFAASGEIECTPTPRDTTTSHILRRHGCYVDVITEVMPPPQWDRYNEWSSLVLKDTKAWLDSIIRFARLGPDSGSAEDYIWRTLRLDEEPKGLDPSDPAKRTPPSGDFLRLVRKIMRQEPIDAASLNARESEIVRKGFINFAVHHPDLDTLDKQISYVMREWPDSVACDSRGRTLFRTAKAMFGLGHEAIKPGDIVTLLWGIESPIVLRPRTDGAAGGGYTFLGDAYVDGIMYGEFLETKPTEVCFDIY